MPDHLRALFVILFLAIPVFALAKNPSLPLIAATDFTARRNLWLGITLIAFLARNFWVYIILTGALLLSTGAKEHNKIARYFFLLFAVPPIAYQIPGFGGIHYFFDMDYFHLLSLVILFPAALTLHKQSNAIPFGKTMPDKLLIGYVGFNLFLIFISGSFTSFLRGIFLNCLDILLPYYVASRGLKTIEDFRDALMSFVLAAMVMAAIGIFESARAWLLYATLQTALNIDLASFTSYVTRGESLRAMASTGQPIPFGYALAVALTLMLYLQKCVQNAFRRKCALLLLATGLVVSYSRGPWIGTIVAGLIFVLLGPRPGAQLGKSVAVAAVVLGILMATPQGEKIVQFLPFIGSEESGSVTYRQQLIDIMVPIVLNNPIFGASEYLYSPAVEGLRQGQGIIDLVNTYLIVALYSGLVGLGFYCGFFATIGFGIYTAMRQIADKVDERHLLGQSLLATLVGILIIIFTVSNISVIPYIYWCIAGVGQAYWVMVGQSAQADAKIHSTSVQSADAINNPSLAAHEPW